MPERESSRKKNKKQTTSLTVDRRNLLILGVISGIGLTTGTCWLLTPKNETSKVPASPTTQPAQNKDKILALRQRLFELDTAVFAKPETLQEKAVEVGTIAKRFFDSEMDYPSNRVQTNILYLWEDEFGQKVEQHNSCNDQLDNISSDTRGFTEVLTNDIYINLNYALGNEKGRANPKIEQHAATILFSIINHELHHAAAPIAKFTPPERAFDRQLQRVIEAEFNKGLAWFTSIPELSLPGRQCIGKYRGALEEAVVHDDTARMLDKVGIRISTEYDQLIAVYRREVVNKLFRGNHRLLLTYQQNTQPQSFFIEIGKQLGYRDSLQQLEQGENYLSQIFSRYQ